MPLDGLEAGAHGVVQRSGVGIAHERGEALHLLRPLGQSVGLLVGDHLQAVLEAAQEAVGLDQVVGGLRLDPARLRQRPQRRAGGRRPRFRQSAAEDQLLGLDEELDLADAAATDFEVVAGDPDPAVAAMRVDLPLDRMDVADRGEVEKAAPQEGAQPAQQAQADRLIARDHARLDQRRPLPVLAVALVIFRGILDRQRQGLAGRMRPQPEVDPEHVALLGALLEQIDQGAGQAHGERHRAVPAPVAQPLRREQDDQVEVARVVQLEGAKLAHAEHGDAGGRLRIGFAGELDLAALGGFHEGLVQRLADREVGEAAERVRDLLERPQIEDVGERHREGDLALVPAQRRHEALAGAERRIPGLLDQCLDHPVGPIGHDRAHQIRLRQRRFPEIGAVPEDHRERALELGRGIPGRMRVIGGLAEPRPAREAALRCCRIADAR